MSFLHGIFFAPSFSQATVPELQHLVMADACHLNFGRYTLYSYYGITANSNMFPVGFAIVFGNENLLSWKEFLKFIIELHPCLNIPDVTIVTDQDKGLFGAITEEVSEVVNIHCSYHRLQNIIEMCGAKSGNKVYLAPGCTIVCCNVALLPNLKGRRRKLSHGCTGQTCSTSTLCQMNLSIQLQDAPRLQESACITIHRWQR